MNVPCPLHRSIGSLFLAVVTMLHVSSPLQAVTGTWAPTGAGTYYWHDRNPGDANFPRTPAWGVTGLGVDGNPFVLNATPNATGDIALINNDILGNQVIVLDAPITLGSLSLGDADGSNTFSIVPGNGGSLVFNNGGSTATLAKAAGSTSTDSISANISLLDSLSANIADGSISLTGIISEAPLAPRGITKTGAGTLIVSGANTYTGGTTINEGVVSLGSSTVGGLAGSSISSGPLGTGTVTIGNTGAVRLQSSLSIPATVIRTLANALVVNGNFTLGATGTGSVLLGGTVNLGGATRTITVEGNQFITGLISNGSLTTAGTGTLHIRNLNTGLTGTTTLGAGTTTVVGASAVAGTAAAQTANPFGSTALTMGGNTIASDIARTISNNITLTGNLTFGADPRTAGNYDGQVTLGGTVGLGGAVRTITTNTSGVPTYISGTADTISGAISNGGIIKEGNGRLVLNGTNTTLTGIQVNAGVLQINAAGGFGNNPASVAAGAGYLNLNGGVLAFNNASQTNAPANMGVNIAANSTFDIMGAGNLVLFNNSAALLTGTGDITKLGASALILTGSGSSTWSGNLNIVQGMVMAGTTTTVSSGQNLAAVNSISIQSTATLRVSNGTAAAGNNADRVNNAAGITMNGGLVEFLGGAGISFSETLGVTTLNRGANAIVAAQSAATFTSTLTFASLQRNTGAVVNFASGTAFAAGTAGLGQTNQNSIILTLINGVAPTPGFIGGWATVNTSAASTYATGTVATEWAKYDATLGVQPFLAADYLATSTDQTTWASGSHVKLTAAATTTLTAPRTVATLNLQQGGAVSIAQAGNSLRIESGGILVSGAFAASITGTAGNSLTAGSVTDVAAELFVNTSQAAGHATQIITIGSTITNNGTGVLSLVKSGTGVLALTGVNSFTGGVYLNQGTLRLTPGPNGTSLALPSSNSISVVNGVLASTGAGVLVLANNMTIYDTLTLGDATGAARHVLTGNITLSAPTGGIASIIAHTNTLAEIRGSISGGSLRIAQVGATGRVALTGTNSFGVNDRIQVDSGILTVGSAGALGSAKIVINGGGLESGFGFRGAITNDILFTGNGTFASTGYDQSLVLNGTIDLGGAFRTITGGANPGPYTVINGVITNGGFDKASNGYVILTNGANNYLGGTTVSDGVLWLKGDGVAGANVAGNNISLTFNTNGDIGIKLDGPNNLGSNQILTLSPSSGTGAQAISLGSGFAGATTTSPLIGFQNGATGTGTGIMNVRINDIASGKLLISLDGITLKQDVINGTGITGLPAVAGSTNAAAPLTRVWIGASQAGGIIDAPISAGFGGAYRFGGGLDMVTTSANQSGTLQINAGVLSGSGMLYIGAEDNTAISNLAGNSVVWMRGAQSAFTGNVTIGSGGVLNVADGSYLGSAATTSITLRGGTLRVLNESGLAGFDSSHINTTFANGTSTKNIVVGVGGGTYRQDSGTGNFSNQVVQFGSLTIDASDNTGSNRTFTVADGGVNSGGTLFSSLTLTNNGTNAGILNVTSNFVRITGGVTVGAGGFQKAGAGTLIFDTPSTTTLGGTLDLNAGTLILTNPSNFSAPATTVSGSSTLMARSNAGTYNLSLGTVALSGGNLTLIIGNLDTAGSASSTVTFNSTLNSSIATRTLTVRAYDNTTVNGTGALNINTSAFGFVFDIQAGYYNQSGLITGAAGTTAISKSGRGFLELSNGSNSFAGGLNAGLGTILISATGAQGSGTISFTSGSGHFFAGDGVTIGNALQLSTSSAGTNYFGGISGSQSFTGNFNIAAVTGLTSTVGVANFSPTGVTTFSTGVISQGNAGVNNILKTGNGTVVFNSSNTYGSAAAVTNTVQRGTFEGVAQATGSPFGNSTNNFVIGGGTLKLTGLATTTSTVHSGSLVVGGANYGGRLVIDATAGGSTTFTVGSLGTRAGRGTLVYVPQIGTGNEVLGITTAPTGVNIANGIVAPWFLMQTSGTVTTGNFIAAGSSTIAEKTYTAGVDEGNLDTLNGANLVLNNTSAATLTANRSIYSLRTDSDINLGTFALNIGQQDVPTAAVNQVSGLILNNGASINGASGSELHMGSSEMHVFVGGGSTSTISVRIASLDLANSLSTLTNAGLTKSGGGTLILTGANRYMGLTTVANGVLQAGAANVLGQFSLTQKNQASGLQIAAGATFDMSGTGYNQTIGSLAGQGTINIGANRLIVGNDNTSTTFSGQLIAAAGSILQKTGTGTLTLSNMLTGTQANSVPSSIYVDQGTLLVHVSDGAANILPNGDTFALQTQSAIASGTTFILRGGTLTLGINQGDVTANALTVRSNYNVVVELSSTFGSASGLIGTNDNKQLSINNLTLNRFTLSTASGNTNIFQVDGSVILSDIANINAAVYFDINGDITDGGKYYTLNKTGIQTMYVNSNTTFKGGTILNQNTTTTSGTAAIRFGTAGQWEDHFELTGNSGAFTYNSTAKLGTGDIWIQPSATVGISSIRLAETNLNPDQQLFVRSASYGANQSLVEVMHDAPLSSYNLRSTTSGALGFILSPTAGSANLARWTSTLDQQRIGNGTWGFSGTTDIVYDNSTLGAGMGETYRFYGTNAGAFVVTEAGTLTGANQVVIGTSTRMPGSLNPAGTSAAVVLVADQNYTGSTTIMRGGAVNGNLRGAAANQLRVYGDLTTSGIENYGILRFIGNGRVTSDAGVNQFTVTLRPGSFLDFDYDAGFGNASSQYASYLADISTTTGVNASGTINKWSDTTALTLTGATLSLTNATTRDTTEIIGGLNSSGLSDIVLNLRTNGSMVLELNGALAFNNATDTLRFTGTGFGTAGPTAGSGTGSTRVLFTNAANAPAVFGTLTNGATVVSPRFFSATGNTFVGYTTGEGFMAIAPNLTSNTATMAATTSTDYVDQTVAATSVATTQNVYLLRTSAGISSTATYTLNIAGNGWVMNNGTTATAFTGFQSTTQASAITASVNFTGTGPAFIWSAANAQNWIRTNISTTGDLVLNGATSGGAAQFVLSGNNSIAGSLVLNGGTLNLWKDNNDGASTPTYFNSAAASAIDPTGGTGTSIILMGASASNAANAFPRLELRIAASGTITSRTLVIGDTSGHTAPYVEINVDRSNATSTGQAITLGGGMTVNGSATSGSEGTNILITTGNTYTLTIGGTITLNPVFVNISNSATTTFSGTVTGTSQLIKTNTATLTLNGAANSYSGGTVLNAGTLQVSGTGSSTATFLGTGAIFINGGVLQINGANTATLNYASAAGNSLIVGGNFQQNTQGATQLMLMGNASALWQTVNSPVMRFDGTNSNSASFQWIGGLRIYDNPNFYVNNDQGNSIRGGVIIGSNSASNTFQGTGTLTKTGYGNLTFNFGAGSNTFAGDINVFQGGIRAEQAADKYTSGNITLNPGTWIVARANAALTYNPSQITYFASNSTALAGLVLRSTDSYALHLNASSIFTGNADGSTVGTPGSGTNGGSLAIEGTYAGPVLNMSTVFGGYWFLGASQQAGTYNLASLGAGAADTVHYGASNTGVYRLGGGDNTLTLSTTANLLTGANAAVQIGKPWALNGRGAVEIQVSNNYGGGTVVAIGRDRNGGLVLNGLQVSVGGGAAAATSTPFGTGQVDVYGRIQFRGATGSAVGATVNVNDNVYVFHPGSRLYFDYNNSNTLTQAQGGKWGDTTAIVLNGTSLELNGANTSNSTANHEIVGDITFGRMNEIRIIGTGTNGTAAITTSSLIRNSSTYGFLRFTHSGNVLGSLSSTTNDAENFIITNFASANTAGSGDWGNVTGTGHYSLTNDAVMLNPYMVSATDNQWMRYNATNGIQTLFSNGTSMGSTYLRMNASGSIGTGSTVPLAGFSVAGGTVTFGTASTGMLNNGTEILDLNNVTATLSSNLDVLALRWSGNLNQDATNAFNTVQIRSGGMILNTANAEGTIRANLVFGTAAAPGTAYVYAIQSTTNLDGQITATDFVKAGGGVVRIAQDQRSFAGKWVINQGTLEFNSAYGMGTNGTNEVLLNGGFNTNTDAFSFPTLQLVTQNGSQNLSGDLSLGTFYHGLITVVDAGQIQFFSPSDRQVQVQNVRLETTNSATQKGLQPGYFQVTMQNSRTISNFGTVTLDDDYIFKIESAAFSSATQLGMGNSTGARFNTLNNQGLYNITKIGDGTLYLGDISSSFTGNRIITINEGSARAEHISGSLGSAGTTFIVDNGGALDIAVANFAPVATLVQRVGSIERWSVDGARPDASFTLSAGVHLQINQSQTGTQTINLNGGSLMGYLAGDLDEVAVIRTLDSGVSINLLADSYLGQIYPFTGTIAYDMGKQNGYVSDPFNPRLIGAILDIKGQITGGFNLTKLGTDVIQISSTGNTYNNTFIEGGVLMMGTADALPTTKRVTTSANGILDLNGYNTRVGSISGTTGTITSGATTRTSLNVGGDNTDFSYTGTVAQGVRIVKEGTGEFTLGSPGVTATVTQGSKVVTVASTDGWYVGMPVDGPGIPSGTTIAAITSKTTILLSTEATASGTRITPANINWGGIEIAAGRVKISDDANLGLAPNTTEADNITLSGGVLHIAETLALSATRGFTVTAAGGGVEVDATKTLTVPGPVVLSGRFSTSGGGNAVFDGVISGTGSFVQASTGTTTLNAVNTLTGKVEVASGTLALGPNAAFADASWIEVKTSSDLNTSAVVGGAQVDGVVSGQGTITGSLVVTSNVGAANAVGVLRPGASSVDDVASAGDLNGTLTITGDLTLAGSATPVTRASMSVTSATLNDAANIMNANDTGTLLTYLNSQESTWNAAAIPAGAHDAIIVGGTMTFGRNGQIEITGWTPQYGDVLDLFDWVNVVIADFDHGASTTNNFRNGGALGDLVLPTISSELSYNMTLFNTSGIVVVVPEPGKTSLLLLGFLTLCLRRRRPRGTLRALRSAE